MRNGFAFEQVDGYIKYIKLGPKDPLWVKNLKRGIANLFTLNIVGKKDESATFSSLEVLIKIQSLCFYLR